MPKFAARNFAAALILSICLITPFVNAGPVQERGDDPNPAAGHVFITGDIQEFFKSCRDGKKPCAVFFDFNAILC